MILILLMSYFVHDTNEWFKPNDLNRIGMYAEHKIRILLFITKLIVLNNIKEEDNITHCNLCDIIL